MASLRALSSTRVGTFFYRKAPSSTQVLASCSIWCRRNLYGSLRRHNSMSAWVIDQYGTNEVLRVSDEIMMPTINLASEVLIKVEAASLNPLDISMRGGYGATLLKLRRDPMSVMQNDTEFPLILGRDVSGVVVECGSQVTHFAPGDEVSHKPKSLSHTEAASVPYVATTALSALVNAAGLCSDNCSDKRVLITGGSGGVGTFSIQLLKAWGAHVTVTCAGNAEGLVRGLGADEVVDYTAGDVAAQLEATEKYDVVLDNVGGVDTERWALGLLRPWSGAKYVTLVSPLLHSTDAAGLVEGLGRSGCSLHSKALQNLLSRGVFYRWGFYAPDGPALDEVSALVDAGKVSLHLCLSVSLCLFLSLSSPLSVSLSPLCLSVSPLSLPLLLPLPSYFQLLHVFLNCVFLFDGGSSLWPPAEKPRPLRCNAPPRPLPGPLTSPSACPEQVTVTWAPQSLRG
ncbi:reticulon-4-interacting protein 1 homolog, mitochondrial isoform X3 [Gadus morhua]|uniref:reticulon-4-interacting protein 1 homolog, mitochondrial isoform X3 n=1 Tax=Gadus morhua TaxID=8049 RepID=UPI0011B5F449|nr:reticulon-4-interacting protein 1 homolog, mitochondrial-like isoform X3 [Gadus morhua]